MELVDGLSLLGLAWSQHVRVDLQVQHMGLLAFVHVLATWCLVLEGLREVYISTRWAVSNTLPYLVQWLVHPFEEYLGSASADKHEQDSFLF